eukprot:TRINITY_DN4543_c0_g1_i1.p1 TRINITY_DN4543_c0_g1~~TRINITY_DN4543_c0_g1_i1.p1  ORF type:complete len:237 (-),score=6.43 TRINITY_DN4543_c0_g1_i1:314-1024(-)
MYIRLLARQLFRSLENQKKKPYSNNYVVAQSFLCMNHNITLCKMYNIKLFLLGSCLEAKKNIKKENYNNKRQYQLRKYQKKKKLKKFNNCVDITILPYVKCILLNYSYSVVVQKLRRILKKKIIIINDRKERMIIINNNINQENIKKKKNQKNSIIVQISQYYLMQNVQYQIILTRQLFRSQEEYKRENDNNKQQYQLRKYQKINKKSIIVQMFRHFFTYIIILPEIKIIQQRVCL